MRRGPGAANGPLDPAGRPEQKAPGREGHLSTRRGFLTSSAATLAALFLQAACGPAVQHAGSTAAPHPSPAAGTGAAPAQSGTGGTLVIGDTFSALPTMDIYPSQGFEGRRFVGNQLYDPLIIQNPDNLALDPGLAESWVHSTDLRTWVFKLRPGVLFHDGSPWNAAAAVFNLDRLLKPGSPYYYAPVAAPSSSRTKAIAAYDAVDPMTLRLTLKEPDSFFPADLTQVLFASPTAIQRYGNAGYQSHPSGTGPFFYESRVQGQYLRMGPNRKYWRRPPKLDRLELRPMPQDSTRYAALRSGQINWAEVPPPDSVAQLRAAGFQVLLRPYPHVWAILPDLKRPPFNDHRVRQAFVQAVNRRAMCQDLLHGVALPADGPLFPGSRYNPPHPPSYPYDPAAAKRLLAAAGYGRGLSVTVNMPSSGSGNMWPIPMSEYIQEQVAQVGIHVNWKVFDWNEIIGQFLAGFVGPLAGAEGLVFSLSPGQLLSDLQNYFVLPPPGGTDIVGYSNPKVTALVDRAQRTAGNAARDALLTQGWLVVDQDIPWLCMAHDLNLRALAPTVHGFVTPESWWADLTTVWVSGS